MKHSQRHNLARYVRGNQEYEKFMVCTQHESETQNFKNKFLTLTRKLDESVGNTLTISSSLSKRPRLSSPQSVTKVLLTPLPRSCDCHMTIFRIDRVGPRDVQTDLWQETVFYGKSSLYNPPSIDSSPSQTAALVDQNLSFRQQGMLQPWKFHFTLWRLKYTKTL